MRDGRGARGKSGACGGLSLSHTHARGHHGHAPLTIEGPRGGDQGKGRAF